MTLIRDSVEIMALLLSRQQLIGMRNNWPEPYETQRETAVNWRLGAAFHGEPDLTVNPWQIPAKGSRTDHSIGLPAMISVGTISARQRNSERVAPRGRALHQKAAFTRLSRKVPRF
jgi:hypothetical protein